MINVSLCWRVTNFVDESVCLIEWSDEGVCPYLKQQNKQLLLVNIMEDTDATTMCITVYKKAIWLYTNWNANRYFINMWRAEFGDGTRCNSP